jgi:bifunctional aspartokinase / homoserine dehydrogenase 1
MKDKNAESLPVRVYKFGGTSVATADRILRAARLVLDESDVPVRRIVVVSALGGVTDNLVETIELALNRDDRYRTVVADIVARHDRVVSEIAPETDVSRIGSAIKEVWRELEELLDGIYLLRECTPRSRDAILSMGERASVHIMTSAFHQIGAPAVTLRSADLILTDDTFGDAGVYFEETNVAIRKAVEEVPEEAAIVMSGFIGSTRRGVTTTLGRSGSDYTATIVGAAVEAEKVVIWTDVDGVLSADPRLVPDAFTLPQLTYREAAELAYFGAKVLHPRTMRPLQADGIPLFIRNTLNPEADGTRISTHSPQRDGHVKAVTAIRNVAIIMLEGTGLLGVPGISARALTSLANRGINVLMISQASSEQSLCAIVSEDDADRSVAAMEAGFEWELTRGDVSRIFAINECAVISVVGDYMRERPGLAGRMFSTLGRNGVNVLAIAQGAAETNISAVVRDADVRQGVRALHETFALSHDQAHIFIIGDGVVGRALLDILAHQASLLKDRRGIHLRLAGIANSRRILWDPEAGIPFAEASERLASAPEGDINALIEILTTRRLERMIVVDATASADVAMRYPELIENHISVVTPNKRANTLDLPFYDRLHDLARRHNVPYLYETTVGAGLPVVSALRDLIRSGDEVLRVEGVFSGTLAYLFNHLAEGQSFSEVIHEARSLGFTEPDPRDDLKGEDVARKLLIVAREMGMRVDRSDVAVESLVPAELLEVSLDEYMDRLKESDSIWKDRIKTADKQKQRLQYIGTIDGGHLSVRVRAVDEGSPFFHLSGTNCMVLYRTKRYYDSPLVIQGPGAGPAVTAAGIVADLLKSVDLSR